MEKTKISEQWPEFYDKLKKAKRSNMLEFATSLDLIDKYNESLLNYLSDKKIPVVYVDKEKIKGSALFKKWGKVPDGLFWCVYFKFKDVERINIFVNTEAHALLSIAKIAMQSKQDLLPMLETILIHESIHAYLYTMNFHVNYDFTGRAMSMLHLITEKSIISNNPYIKERLSVINESDPQEVITYILTESVLSDFVKSIVIDGKNGWVAYCEFINYIDPFGILLKYATKRQEIPDRIMADAELKFRLYKHKGDTYVRSTTVKEMENGGIISTTDNKNAKLGGILEGNSHKEGGIDILVENTGEIVKGEKDEAIIKKTVVRSNRKYNFEGKNRTPREILNKLNTDGGGNKI